MSVTSYDWFVLFLFAGLIFSLGMLAGTCLIEFRLKRLNNRINQENARRKEKLILNQGRTLNE